MIEGHAAGEIQQEAHDGTGTTHEPLPVRCNLLLVLPAEQEAEFWRSSLLQRTLWTLDLFAVIHALVINTLLFRTFKVLTENIFLPHERLITIFYPVIACWQLWLLCSRPQQYHQHRLAITLFNRLGRLALLAASAALVSPAGVDALAAAAPAFSDMADTTGHRHSSSCSSTSSSSSSSINSGGGGGGSLQAASSAVFLQAAGGDPSHPFALMVLLLQPIWDLIHVTFKLFRPVAGPPMLVLGYSHFVLPLRMTVPQQLLTCALALGVTRVRVCWFVSREGIPELLTLGCSYLFQLVNAVGILFGWPSIGGNVITELPSRSQLCDQPITSAVQLTLFTQVQLLVVIPAAVTYILELSLKDRFLRSKGQRLVHRLPSSLLGSIAAVLTSLVTTWLLCDALTRLLPHPECDAEGWLVWGQQSP